MSNPRLAVTAARELRAALGEALDPLYAARTGTIPALDAACRAITVLHRIDAALLRAINGADVGAPGGPVLPSVLLHPEKDR